MADYDKITDAIISSSAKECEEIIKNAKDKSYREIDEVKAELEKKFNEFAKEADEKAKLTEVKFKSSARRAEQMVLLKKKKEIMSDLINDAINEIVNKDTASYFEILLGLVSKSLLPEAGEIVLNDKDKKRLPDDFIFKANSIAESKGGTLSLSSDTCDTIGGLVLRYGFIEINSTIEELMSDCHEELEDELINILWNE